MLYPRSKRHWWLYVMKWHYLYLTVTSLWAQWRLQSPASRLVTLFFTLFRRRSNKHQSSASLAFVEGTHRWLVNFPRKWPVTRKIFPFDDVSLSYNSVYWNTEVKTDQWVLQTELNAHCRCKANIQLKTLQHQKAICRQGIKDEAHAN